MTAKSLRIALTVDDFERSVSFYLDGLGLDPSALWTENGHGQMFGAGEAALVHEPGLTPRQELNVRLRSPEELQITLFQIQDEANREQAKEGKQ